MTKFKLQNSIIIIYALATFLISTSIAAQESGLGKVWLVGKENGAYGDFSSTPAKMSMQGYDSAYEGRFEIKAGGKTFKGGFPGIQAGPLAPWGKYREYPINVLFKLNTRAPGGYFLTISLIGVSTGDSAELKVVAGDHQEILYPEAGFKDELLTMSQGYGTQQDMTLFLPTENMHEGINSITITLTQGEWVIYDIIRLEEITSPDVMILKNFKADVAPFLANSTPAPGHLVTVKFAASRKSANSQIKIDTGADIVQTKVDIKPGQNSFDIIVPEITATTSCTVSLEVDGQSICSISAV